MSYLDPKEQVLDLQLTPYGEFLLSVGKLNPKFYAFFDQDVIYNSAFANNSSEDQNDIQERILNETPRMAAQKSLSGREEDYINKRFPLSNLMDDNMKFLQDVFNPESFNSANYTLASGLTEVDILNVIGSTPEPMQEALKLQPMGKYDSSKGFAPAWNVSFLKTELSSSTDSLSISGSKGTLEYNIPQLNASLEYKIKRNSKAYNIINEPENLVGEVDPTIAPSKINTVDRIDFIQFENGGSIETLQDFLVIRLEESNTFFEKENFEVEMFESSTDLITGKEVLIKKPFYKNKDVFLEDVIKGYVAPNSVENFFDIAVDKEIDPEVICPLIGIDKTKQFYIAKMFDCEDEPIISIDDNQFKQNIYYEDDDTKDVCE